MSMSTWISFLKMKLFFRLRKISGFLGLARLWIIELVAGSLQLIANSFQDGSIFLRMNTMSVPIIRKATLPIKVQVGKVRADYSEHDKCRIL